MPTSEETTVPPVTAARSSRNALRRSPKYGALTATARIVLRTELTTSVDSASPSTSSATITTGLPAWAIFSRIGSRSLSEEILSRYSRMYVSSTTASCASGSVTKYAET
jgi:hypothetical protein